MTDILEDPAPQRTVAQDVPEPEPWDRQRDRRAALLLFVGVLVVYLLTATYSAVQLNDNRAVNLSAWSLGTQGSFALPSEWEGQLLWIKEGRDGNLYTDRFPGAVLWAAPFHAVGELILQRGTPPHIAFLSYVPGGVAAATVTALAVLVTFLILRRLADRRLALAATLVVAFGTGTWSVSADAMWTHGLTHLTLSLGVLAAADERHVRSGLAFAAAVLTRPQTAFVPAIVGLWAGWNRRSVRPVVVIGILSGLGVVALSAYSYRLFGTPLPIAGYGEGKVAAVASTPVWDTGERVLFTLAHPMRGVLIYAPFLIVLLPFVRYGWRVSPWWVRSSAIGGSVYLLVQLRSNTWHGGADFFGSRLTLETLVLVAPLLLRTWQSFVRHNPKLQGSCVALCLVAVGWHAFGAVVRPVFPESAEHYEQSLVTLCEDNPDYADFRECQRVLP